MFESPVIIQIATVITALAAAWYWLKFGENYTIHRYAVVAPVSYLIHTLVFYTCVWLFDLNGTIIGLIWSASLRWHTQATFLIMALQINLEFRQKEIKHRGD